MKNIILYICLLLALLNGACKDNGDYLYDSPDNIYFDFDKTEYSQITCSFANHPESVADTIWLPVRISGKRVAYPRYFKIVEISKSTTGQPEINYKPLESKYEIAADSGCLNVPVVIYNTDPAMDDSTFTLTLALAETSDFQVSLLYIPEVSISFSNRLEPPSWWMYWMANLGTYSRIKHQLFLISSGTTELVDMSKPDAYLEIPKTLFHIDQYKAFLNDPFTWVKKHDTYSLREIESGIYHFYQDTAPEKVILLKIDPALGSYRFVDENGQFIS